MMKKPSVDEPSPPIDDLELPLLFFFFFGFFIFLFKLLSFTIIFPKNIEEYPTIDIKHKENGI